MKSPSYRPAGPTIAEFHRAAQLRRSRALIGPVWAGRKTAASAEILGRVRPARDGEPARVRWFVVAPTETVLTEEIISAWHLAMPAEQGQYTVEGHDRRHLVPLLREGQPPGGLDVHFLAWERAEHRRRLATTDVTGVWLANARDLPREAFDDALGAADGNYPPPGRGEPGWYGVIITSRMPPAGHWVYELAGNDIDLFRQPGGRTPQAENLANLPSGFYQRLAQRYRHSPERVRADVDAEIAGSAEATAAEAARAAARGSLTVFASVVMPDVQPALHHQFIIDKLERVARGEINRLMLFLPPGSAKSTYASVLFPPWFMGNHPGMPVIAASHAKELAERFGRRVRNIVDSPQFREIFGFGLSADSGAAGRWETAKGGEYFAVGVDASVTGRRAGLGIIDDPVKGQAEADSPTVREHVWQWYKSDFWTRLIPNAPIIYIGTRWHEDDLAGRLLEEAKNGGEQWEIVKLAAIAGEDDPLGRAPGQRLWPDWYTEDQFRIAQQRDARTWSALYQQEPMPESGDYFKAEWIRYYDRLPPLETLNCYGASDYATKANAGDYTVHLVVGLDPDSNIYLIDLYRDRAATDQWVEVLLDMMERWHPISWAEEQGQIRAAVGPFITRRQRERKVFARRRQFTSGTDKATRAQAIRGRMSMGMVWLPRQTLWVNGLVQELLRFPAARHDDQVDTLGLIGRMLDEMVPGTRPVVRPQPLAAATLVTGMDMPLDWHFIHSTNEAIRRRDGAGQRI
jgi:predicted phage terminase large subunit-like protein